MLLPDGFAKPPRFALENSMFVLRARAGGFKHLNPCKCCQGLVLGYVVAKSGFVLALP